MCKCEHNREQHFLGDEYEGYLWCRADGCTCDLFKQVSTPPTQREKKMESFEVERWNSEIDAWQTDAIFFTLSDADIYIEAKILRHMGKATDYRMRKPNRRSQKAD
jgi:hypothetical protein